MNQKSLTNKEVIPIVEDIVETAMSISDEMKQDSTDSLDVINLFSNISIGFEENQNPPLIYFLPWETLVTVFTACSPMEPELRNLRNQNFFEHLEVLYKELKSPEFNDQVLAHELLNNEKFRELIERNFKFCIHNPFDIVQSLILDDLNLNS